MGIRMMGRADFCKLAGLEVEQYNVMRRRYQVPLVPNVDLPDEIANERGHEAFGALALIIANEFAERYEMSRNRAADITAYSHKTFSRWDEIAKTSAQVVAGKTPDSDILYAAIEWPGQRPSKNAPAPKIAVGSLKEIATHFPNAGGVIAVSVTRCATLLRKRAERANIDLADFWKRW